MRARPAKGGILTKQRRYIVQGNHPTSLSFFPSILPRSLPRSLFALSLLDSLDLELGLGLRLLEDGVELGGLHDVALDLELARHEEALGVGLAGDEVAEVGVREGEGDWRRSDNMSVK